MQESKLGSDSEDGALHSTWSTRRTLFSWFLHCQLWNSACWSLIICTGYGGNHCISSSMSWL